MSVLCVMRRSCCVNTEYKLSIFFCALLLLALCCSPPPTNHPPHTLLTLTLPPHLSLTLFFCYAFLYLSLLTLCIFSSFNPHPPSGCQIWHTQLFGCVYTYVYIWLSTFLFVWNNNFMGVHLLVFDIHDFDRPLFGVGVGIFLWRLYRSSALRQFRMCHKCTWLFFFVFNLWGLSSSFLKPPPPPKWNPHNNSVWAHFV